MQAYTIKNYGNPEQVLQLTEVEKPEPKLDEVLIKVHATTINDYDWCITTGKPYAYRLLFGIFRPRRKLLIPGMEVAGVVEKVGAEVEKFKPGDAVYGDTSDYGFGSFAEYMRINVKALSHKPSNMSFAEAASIPHASMLALQGLREVGQIQNGQKILINGGGGGVGFFALQLAKVQDAEVTGVDTGEKLGMMKELGYDHIIDYKQTDFAKGKEKYDLILDCRTSRSPFAYSKALKPDGKYVTVGGRTGKLLSMLFFKPWFALFSKKRFHLVGLKSNKDLAYINELYDAGKIKCQIDGPYEFEKLPWAVRRFGEALHTGKVVISLSNQ